MSCAICTSDLNSAPCVALRCKHEFHSTCIVKALRISSLCPICRDRGHSGFTESDAISMISTNLMREFQAEAARIYSVHHVRTRVEDLHQDGTADARAVVAQFRREEANCKAEALRVSKYKLAAFKQFKRQLDSKGQQYKAFKKLKQSLYRRTAALRRHLPDVTDEDWRAFTCELYKSSSRQSHIPIDVVL